MEIRRLTQRRVQRLDRDRRDRRPFNAPLSRITESGTLSSPEWRDTPLHPRRPCASCARRACSAPESAWRVLRPRRPRPGGSLFRDARAVLRDAAVAESPASARRGKDPRCARRDSRVVTRASRRGDTLDSRVAAGGHTSPPRQSARGRVAASTAPLPRTLTLSLPPPLTLVGHWGIYTPETRCRGAKWRAAKAGGVRGGYAAKGVGGH